MTVFYIPNPTQYLKLTTLLTINKHFFRFNSSIQSSTIQTTSLVDFQNEPKMYQMRLSNGYKGVSPYHINHKGQVSLLWISTATWRAWNFHRYGNLFMSFQHSGELQEFPRLWLCGGLILNRAFVAPLPLRPCSTISPPLWQGERPSCLDSSLVVLRPRLLLFIC